MSGQPKIESILRSYFNIINSITDAIFEPPRRFLEPFSKSISETFAVVSRVMTNFLTLLPLFIFSVAVGIYFFGSSSDALSSTDPLTVVSVMMFFASLISLVIMSFSDYDLHQSAYMSALLLSGAVSIIFFDAPELYAVLFGVFYGVGGYISSYIGQENPLPHGHIYDNLEPQETITRVSAVGLTLSLASYGIAEYLIINTVSDQIPVILASAIPAIGFLVSSLQFGSYKIIYQHAELNKESRLWILTPRLLVILGIALSISDMNVGVISLIAMISPSLFGLAFSYYLSSQTKEILGQKKFTDSDRLANPVRITGNESADVVAEVDKKSSTASLSIDLEVDISEEVPNNRADPWFEAVAVSRELLDAVDNLKRVDEEVSEKIEKFRRDSLEVAIDKYGGSTIDWDDIPESIRRDVIAIKCQKGELSLQEVSDLDIRFGENRSKKSAKRYVDRL